MSVSNECGQTERNIFITPSSPNPTQLIATSNSRRYSKSTASLSCNNTNTPIRIYYYHAPLKVGTKIYIDVNNTALNGNSQWWKLANSVSAKINSSGIVTDLDYCGNPPPP